jgi:SAM-dependent methyltransferase
MYLLRRALGLVFRDEADKKVQELWSQYQACCTRVMDGATVLDVGCGPGEHSHEVLRLWNAAWYAGVDVSVGMVRDAKLRYPAVNFIAADGCSLPFPNGSFDVVTSSFAFHHVPVALRRKFLQEQLRVGKIVLLRDLFGMEPGWRGWLYRMYYVIFDGSEYRFTLREWHRFIESTGAEIVLESHSPLDVVRNRHCFFLIRPILSSGFRYDQVEDCCDF